MDYSVGSIADLITGKNTPNKPKIVAKHIENPQKIEPQITESPQSDLVDNRSENKSKKRKIRDNFNENVVETESKRIRVKNKSKIAPDPDELARTIFVGNLPITTKKLQLKKFFKKYGTVETVRLRNVTPSESKIPKKVALITKQLHPDRKSLTGFVRFSTPEDAQNATKTNGHQFNEHHIRVEVCSDEKQYDETRAIFVGNLPFDAEEEDLWRVFEPCGDISSIRMIRDSNTGIGKGFAYVNFITSDSVQLALELDDVKLKDRELRINLCNTKAAKKNRKLNKNKPIEKAGRPKKPRWRKLENQTKIEHDRGNVQNKNQEFQGVVVSKKKKKRKVSRVFLEKKKLIKQIIGHAEKKTV